MKKLFFGIFLLVAFGVKAQTYVKIPFIQPQPFTVSGDTINKSIQSGASLQLGLDIEINGGSGHYSFVWTNGNVNLGALPTLTISQSGNYILNIQDGSGCESQVVYVVSSNTATDRVLEQKINIFPNPASNVIFIQAPDLGKLNQISLYSVTGELVKTYIPEDKSASAAGVNLDGVKDGQYLLTCTFGNDKITRIILKKSQK